MNALEPVHFTDDTKLHTGQELMPRATAETIVRQRDNALSQYERAHAALVVASETVKKANELANAISSGTEDRFTYHLRGDKDKFMHVEDLQDRASYMTIARRIVDTEAWSHIIKITDLERLMDKQAKDQLHQQLLTDPPEATVENIYATLKQFCLDADTIFRRGIANCFSSLDRRFRSHDGFKIGHRIILDRAFDDSGYWNYHRDQRAAMMDVERVFCELDGLKQSESGSIVYLLERDRSKSWGARQSETESSYFKVRCYKNGNMHIWFKSDQLLEQVNKLLAEYYGEVIPDGMTPEDDGGLFTPKTSLAKNYGFFPTPDKAAQTLIEKAGLFRRDGDPPLTILEPSAGTGNLARLCTAYVNEEWDHEEGRRVKKRYPHHVDCVEFQADLAEKLRDSMPDGMRYRSVYRADFLTLKPETTGLYDRVVMNPPFDRERDIDHVMHAMNFLKPEGILVAIMSAGTEFRETRKATAFREYMKKLSARWTDLPAGSFSEAGTNVNTLILKVAKDGHNTY